MFPRLFVALLFSLVVSAQQQKPVVVPYQPTYAELQSYLALVPEQLTQLKQIQQNRQLAAQAGYMLVTVKQKELNDLLTSGSTDAMSIGKLSIEIQQMKAQVVAPSNERELALAVLNGDQRQKLAALQQALVLRQAADQAASLRIIDYPKPAVLMRTPAK